MPQIILALIKHAANLIKRFLSNVPGSPYEAIIFNSIRTLAQQFGKAATA